jgi:cytochrome d ubiquinol oxidase subunit I
MFDLIIMAAQPVPLTPARSQMAFTLAFHILLVPMGVVLPTIMLVANYKGLRHKDVAAMTIARRWSHVAGLLFAIGAVTGTVLSFEMGLLWPGFTEVFGDVFGLPFAIEGIAFFLEALLVAIYIYGWRRMKPWKHFWFGVPIPLVAIVGAASIISANSWMNSPAGFTLDSNGMPTNIDPLAAMFNKALPLELTHFLLAAYMAASFMVASVYVVGWMKGRRDRYHRLGFLIPFTIGAIATPLQFVVGDSIARWVYREWPPRSPCTPTHCRCSTALPTAAGPCSSSASSHWRPLCCWRCAGQPAACGSSPPSVSRRWCGREPSPSTRTCCHSAGRSTAVPAPTSP